jgi:biopolymer transport protein ExbD
MFSASLSALCGLAVILPWPLLAQEAEAGTGRPAGFDLPTPALELKRESSRSEREKVETVFVDAQGHYKFAGSVVGLDKLVSKLKSAAVTDPTISIAVETDAKAPLHQLVALLSQLDKAGLSRVSLETGSRSIPLSNQPDEAAIRHMPDGKVPHAMMSPRIFDIAFGVWRPGLSKQTGPAAAGREGDFWNAVGVAFNNDHTEADLKFASGEPSPVQVRMINLGGGWGSGGKMGIKAPMMDTYDYPVNNQGGNSQVILKEVPPGMYDIYIYGHELDPRANGDYTLTVGNRPYGRKQTSNQRDAIANTTWFEGSQYVKYGSVAIGGGDEVGILIQPGGQITDQMGRTFSDAVICGLQLIPANDLR